MTGNFFLNAPLVLQAVSAFDQRDGWVNGGAINGLVVRNNIYAPPGGAAKASCASYGCKPLIMNGTFRYVRQVEVESNVDVGKAHPGPGGNDTTGDNTWLSTRAALTLTQTQATRWVFDFTRLLVFPERIEDVHYSVTSNSTEWFQHLARPAVGGVVVVETSTAVDATIAVQVAQGLAK